MSKQIRELWKHREMATDHIDDAMDKECRYDFWEGVISGLYHEFRFVKLYATWPIRSAVRGKVEELNNE